MERHCRGEDLPFRADRWSGKGVCNDGARHNNLSQGVAKRRVGGIRIDCGCGCLRDASLKEGNCREEER